MTNKFIWLVIALILILLMLFGNKKVSVTKVFCKQLQVFRNAKKDKFSIWDFSCFVVKPILLAYIITYVFNININEKIAVTLTPIFAIVFTILFGFATIIISKINSDNKVERQVVGETFVSIISASLLSLIAAIISIVIMLTDKICLIDFLSVVLFSISFMTIMLLLIIIKRTFIIYCDFSENPNK